MNHTIVLRTKKEFADFLVTQTVNYAYYHTPGGILRIASTSLGIHEAVFVDVPDNMPLLDISKIGEPLILIGTDFQQRVWRETLNIPAGNTKTYQEIAYAAGNAQAYRAAATALANNKIAYFIPCHRIIGKDGKLHGYRWNIARKKALLLAENSCGLL